MKAVLSKTMNRCLIGGLTAAAILSAPAMALAQEVSAQPRQQATQRRAVMSDTERAQYKRYEEDRTQAQLNLWASQLNIQERQQPQWTSYCSAVKNMATLRFTMKPPAPNADAATFEQFQAQQAMQRAEAMSVLSDATTRLQSVLTPDQQTKFNNLVHPNFAYGYYNNQGNVYYGRGWGHHGGHRGGYGRGYRGGYHHGYGDMPCYGDANMPCNGYGGHCPYY